jgi:hypothetical protein
MAIAAQADTITVTNTNDSGPGSLRQALVDANDGDTITFVVTGTIGLTSGELSVDKNVTISGPGPDMLAVSRSSNTPFRIFHVMPSQTMNVEGLTISNGNADIGGGILNDQATLTLTNCSVVNNVASQSGGGIADGFAGGSLNIINSTISGNSAVGPFPFTFGYGGGISGGGIITNSTITGNYSGSTGGGIAGSGTITNSTISYNSAGGGKNNFPGDGGGISGGGIITNCTISGNSVFGSPLKGPGLGGGIHAFGATINNSTFSGNYILFYGNGGGICNGGTLEIGNTILNTGAAQGENIFNNGGTITSTGYNVSNDDGGGYLKGPGDQINTDPMLGPLLDNGGPTFTHGLFAGSPAIDKGNNFSGSTTDQRGTGFPRTIDDPAITNAGDGTDIGAFEGVQPTVCPQGLGYWKNNPDAWPASALPMTLGSQTYTKTELLTILKTRIGSGPKADASLILADQLIAAKLNIANGSDPAPVSSTITDADGLLAAFGGNKLPYKVKPSSAIGHMMVNDANTLDSYNNGLLTSGCGL